MKAVLTGLGAVSRFGAGAPLLFSSLSSPLSGPEVAVAPLETPPREERSGSLLLGAAGEAMDEASLDPSPSERRAAILSASKLGIGSLLAGMEGGRAMWPTYLDPVRSARAATGSLGPSIAPIAACATGVVAVAAGASMIESGEADEVVAGTGEASLYPLIIAGFRRMGVLSRSRPRPFDARRDGFVMAEGAAAFVIEKKSAAEERGIRPVISVAGWAFASDAASIHSFNEDGGTVRLVLKKACERARISPRELSFIHLHGTGTRINDTIEARGVMAAGAGAVPIVSTKGATGHALGASGGLGIVIAALALRASRIPPTAGFEAGDETTSRLDISREWRSIPSVGKQARYSAVLAHGFGGHASCLVLAAS